MVPDLQASKFPRRRGLVFAALGLLVVGSLVVGFLVERTIVEVRSETPDFSPHVLAAENVRVAPGESIQSAIDAAGPGATITIGAGVHYGQSITPLDDTVVYGESGAVLDGTGAPLPYAIYGDARNVTVAGLEIRNYTKPIWGPDNYRHQGAIHGALMNAGGGFMAMADQWTIGNNNIHSNAGWGVSPGDGFHIHDNALHHNGMAGIGGGDFNGGLFERNDIFANNDPSNSNGDFNYEMGRPWDWAWNAAGIKVAAVNCRSLVSTGACSDGTPLVIRSNTVHDNHGVGIWCDINCNDVVIEANLVERNIGKDSIGIFYEISQNGTIRNNVVRDQGSSGDYLSPSGILVWSSDTVLVEDNRVENTMNAIVGNARPREFGRTLRNLTVRDNVVITNGRSTRLGIATDTTSDFKTAGNSFVDNWFDQPASMSFWWTDLSRGESSLTFDQWHALGFTTAVAPPSSTPEPKPKPAGPDAAAPSSPPAPLQPPTRDSVADADTAADPKTSPTSSLPTSTLPDLTSETSRAPASNPSAEAGSNRNDDADPDGGISPQAQSGPTPEPSTPRPLDVLSNPPDALALAPDSASAEPTNSTTEPEALGESGKEAGTAPEPATSSEPDLASDTALVTVESDHEGIGATFGRAFVAIVLGLVFWLGARRSVRAR